MDVSQYRLDQFEKRADAADARMARIEDKLTDIQVTLATAEATAFIAKLTDATSPATSALLKYRVFDLYGWTPAGIKAPNRPEGYDQLDWAPTLPPVPDLKAALQARMARRQKDRTVLSVNEVGWLFG